MRRDTPLPAGMDGSESNYGAQAHLSSAGCWITDRPRINFHPGHGLKIVDELTKALDGRFDQKFGVGGSASILVFPISGEPQIPANRRIENRMLVANGYVALDLDLDQSFPIPQTADIELPKTE
jgi:hypothetical protein